jgi:tetratricopeptide (TPR) repeat protein
MSKSHQQFFEKALAIQAQRREKLSEAEKKEIALDLGFSEDDWQAVLASFEGHLKRGTEFLKRNNYEKAITELEDALIIQPEHTGTLAALAQAYLGEFQSKKRKNFKEKALQYAQECLQYAPDNFQAHQVIDAFNPNKNKKYKEYETQIKKQHPQIKITHAKQKNTTNVWKPLKEIGIFLAVLAAIAALFFGTFPSGQIQAPPKKKHEKVEIKKQEKTIEQTYDTQKIPDRTSKKYLRLPIRFVNQDQDYGTFHKQNDSTWLFTDLKGSNLFLIHIVKNDLQAESHTKKGAELSAKLNYGSLFYLSFLSDKVQKQHFNFEPEWKGLPIKSTSKSLFLNPYIPDYLNYQKGDEAYFSCYATSDYANKIQDLVDTLHFKGELVFNLKTKPQAMKPYQKPMNLEIDKQAKTIKVFYEGKNYTDIAFGIQAVSYWQDDKKLNMGITFVIHNQNPQKRKLKTLEYETRFYYRQNRSDTIAQDAIYQISKAISPNMSTPRLHFGKKTFYHTNKTVFADNYQQIAPYYEIYITKLEWE